MDELIGTCGERCSHCAIYVATQQSDDAERRRVAEAYTSDDYPLHVEDINCDGCQDIAGRHFRFCDECPIRLCGLQRGVPNCAHCDDFVCETLAASWEHPRTANARANLKGLHESLQG